MQHNSVYGCFMKTGYDHITKAAHAVAKIKRTKGLRLRYYLCPTCGKYRLTKKAKERA